MLRIKKFIYIAVQIFQNSMYQLSTITKAENSVASPASLTDVLSGTFCMDDIASNACRWQSLYWRWRS